MKYIENRNKEPKELVVYRETTPNPTYEGFHEKKIVRQSLIEEQGYICAYCMGKIKDADDCSIEHYIAQTKHESSPYSLEEHKRNTLLYSNMLAVCLNNSEHCDKKRGKTPFKLLNPHLKTCETLITYTLDGKVTHSGKVKEAVDFDIDTLGLNCDKLKKCRKAVIDEIWDRFKEDHPKKTWSRELFLDYAQKYRTKQKKRGGVYRFHAYCNFIVWYFEYYAYHYKQK